MAFDDVKITLSVAVQQAIAAIKAFGDAWTDAGHKAADAGDSVSDGMLSTLAKMDKWRVVASDVGLVLGTMYDMAREGAEYVGGDMLASYEQFDGILEQIEGRGKGLIAEVLMPWIDLFNQNQQAVSLFDEALAKGVITQDEYNALTYDATTSMALYGDELRKAVAATNALTDAEVRGLEMGRQIATQYDSALGPGLSDVNAHLITQKMLAEEANAAWGLLAQQIAGPVGASNERFAEQQEKLTEHAADLQEQIAALGGLEYISPAQKEQILALRSELIGVTMEILDIEDAYGDAFDDGRTGKKVTAAKDRLEELRGKAWELEQQIIDLGSQPYVSAADLENIEALQEEFGLTQEAIAELADAQEEAMHRMMFNMLQQKLAADVLTNAEVEQLNKIALAWGLIDEETVKAQDAVLLAYDLISNGGNIEEALFTLGLLEESLDAAGDEAAILRDILGDIEGTYSAHVSITVSGADLLAAAADDLAAMQDAHQGVNYGGGSSGGSGASGGSKGTNPALKGASGLDFMVPPGYPNDSYGPMWVQSGEHVKVTPAGELGAMSAPPQFYIILDGEQIAANVIARSGADARIAAATGSAYTGQ